MKITKRQLRKIIKEMHPSRGVNFDITLDKAIQSDGLGTSDVITRDDFYEMIYDFGGELGRGKSWFDSQLPELEKMNIQQVAEFYEDMFHSPEYKEMKAGFDKEDQAIADSNLGYEDDLSSIEKSPKRQGMKRRVESKMKITKRQLQRIIKEERARILREQEESSPANGDHHWPRVDWSNVGELVDKWVDMEEKAWDKGDTSMNPDTKSDRDAQSYWNDQVEGCAMDMEAELTLRIRRIALQTMKEYSQKLIEGDYS